MKYKEIYVDIFTYKHTYMERKTQTLARLTKREDTNYQYQKSIYNIYTNQTVGNQHKEMHTKVTEINQNIIIRKRSSNSLEGRKINPRNKIQRKPEKKK